MARRKRCVVKRRRKEEGNRRKKVEKEEKMGTKSQSQSSFFGSIRNTLLREKHTIFTFVFMQDFFFDEQIM